jgi:hypothetical protein
MIRSQFLAVRLVPALAALVISAAAPAVWSATSPSTLVRKITWSQLQSGGQLREGTIVRPAGGDPAEALRLANPTDNARKFVVAVLRAPGIHRKAWSITGRVRYESVAGVGYFELWNHLPGGGEYFTRSLAPAGPLAGLSGTSGWRNFALPFQAETDAQRPDSLTLDVFLPGRGTVEIGPLEIHEGADAMKLVGIAADAEGSAGPWWSDRAAGRIGAGLGSLMGILGALLGGLMSQGRARKFVEAVLMAGTAFGAALLLGGVFALGARQPSAVVYPLLLAGALLAIPCPLLLRTARQRYREMELRRITAFDAAR